MTPRTGRPPAENPKRHDTRIRMSDEELEKLEFCSKAMGKTKTDVIREGIEIIYQRLRNR